MRIILHADDLGISKHVNREIFHLISEGKLTSASILANGPAFHDAIAGAREARNCSFGVHLNITEFFPVGPRQRLQCLLGPEGEFQRLLPIFITKDVSRAIAEEWCIQVQRVREAGIDVTHIDSHHHVHTRPALFSALQRVCREHGITRVRLCQTFRSAPDYSRFHLLRVMANWRLRNRFTCTDECGPFAGIEDHAFADNLVVEAVLHPGHPGYVPENERFARQIEGEFQRHHQLITHGYLV